jgi:hypothetical protein
MSQPAQPHVRWDADDQHSLWLEPCEGDEYLGLCLGSGDTKAEAIADARRTLSEAAKQLDRLEREA